MASPIRHLRARVLKATFAAHTTIYELSGGRVGAGSSFPMLLLSVTGRESRKTRTTPLVYFRDRDRYVVVGSDGAARRDPQWWKNLQAHPKGRIRVGRHVFPVEARLAESSERERLWELGKGVNPAWERYQQRTERVLPVVILRPVPKVGMTH
jgi:deazaflavin-dependent oxidoreductase (nitroreductase family)